MSAARKLKTSGSSIEGVRRSYVTEAEEYCVILEKNGFDGGPVEFMTKYRAELEEEIKHHGSLILRGFGVDDKNMKETVESLIGTGKNGIMEYKAGFSPRNKVGDKVYTSTVFPKQFGIMQHQDQCYLPIWPRKLFLCSVIPAQKGGETPLVNMRKFMKMIDPKLIEKIKPGVLYIRNFNSNSQLTWQKAYWTEDRKEAERIITAQNMKFEWGPNDSLRTINLSHGVMNHPLTNELFWFNQMHLLSQYSDVPGKMTPALRAELFSWPEGRLERVLKLKPEEYPVVCCYSNGKPIEYSVLEEVAGLFQELEVCFDWKKGDLLTLDNVASCHGRRTFEGERLTIATQGQAWPEYK